MAEGRTNFAFMQVGTDPRAELFVRSVRKTMPQAYIVQCSDADSPEVPGIDKLARHDGNARNLMLFRLECFARLTLNGPAVYLDSDMLMLRPIDLKAILGSADAALCQRVFGRENLINPRCEIDVPEYDGKTFGQVWPFLGCFTAARSNRFWVRCREIVEGLPDKFKFWYGDQEALRIVSKSAEFRIGRFKESDYACLPHFADERRPPYLLHFKGRRQKDVMFGYARNLLGQ